MTDQDRPASAWERGRGAAAREAWERPKRQSVRLACPCTRNLADLRLIWGGLSPRAVAALGPARVAELRAFHPGPEYVFPIPRPGVRQTEHSHGGGRFTFRWDCRCGKTHEARSDRLAAAWAEHAQPGRTVRLVLGRDAL